MRSTLIRLAIALLLIPVLVVGVVPAHPAAAASGKIQGTITDKTTGLPVAGACVMLGRTGRCFLEFGTNPGLHTDAAGFYSIDLDSILAQDHGSWELIFTKDGYQTLFSGVFISNGGYTYNGQMIQKQVTPRASCTDPGPDTGPTLTTTVYLPNITRRLGGPNGFYTPFIIQNTGTANTQLEVSFYKFTDGSCVERYLSNVGPGASHSNDPNDVVKNPSLPDDTQFSVVVKSFGSTIVGVVNEHQNVLDPVRAEALSYDGFTTGAKTVYLPNITRKFFGLFDTPFIIQNLGSSTASVTASFKSFDGTGPTIVIPRTIDPGKAKPIDPDSDDIALGAPGLTDNKQYAVTVSSNQPVAVVVNTQADKPTVAQPVAWSTDGVTTGGADCLADGEYNIKIEAVGGNIAAQVNVSSASTGMGYSATASPATKFFLPNLTKSLCFCPTPTQTTGWTTPILLQSVTATSVTISWYNFLGGSLAFTHTVSLTPGGGMRVDPWSFSQLAPDKQYSVVVDGGTGMVTAIVSEFASGGDNAMIYEGFAAVP